MPSSSHNRAQNNLGQYYAFVALNSLHNNFEMTRLLFFYLGNKDLKKIQLIVTSTKVTNLTKRVTDITKDLVLIIIKKELQQQSPKTRLNKKYFNCGKKSNYIRDCLSHINLKKKPKDEKIEQKTKYAR